MKTPSYLVIAEKLKKNYMQFCEQMKECSVAYSSKANQAEVIIEQLAHVGALFEICSQQELVLMNKYHVPQDRYYCGLPIIGKHEIEEYYSLGCDEFVFDSVDQMESLVKHAPGARLILRIKIDDLSKGAIGYGMPIDEVSNVDYKYVYGIHFHISDHSDMQPTYQALDRVRDLLERYPGIRIVNIGGSYELCKNNEAYDELNHMIFEMKKKYNLRFVCEPGAAIVDSAVYGITQSLYTKEVGAGIVDVYIDGGISSGMLRKPDGMLNLSRKEKCAKTMYRFFDTTSMKKLLFNKRLDIRIEKGDVLCLKNYGAYTYCYSNIFHSKPIPQVFCIEKEEQLGEFV